MKPIFVDIHIHTSDNPNNIDPNYSVETLIVKINEFTNNSEFLISLTDHNAVNKNAAKNIVDILIKQNL